ncbi:enhancer of split m4 protein-like [Musca vetustissima]|uniref:enhancer of split m4 protein-like n=1 Tax=Musca vetustissima TaxID=27455 RepID=UPI002AB65BA2|nr:enhancer of split m4 protein-like [Musca vetustissima]
MCVEIKKVESSNKKKMSYSIKKLLKQIVKHYKMQKFSQSQVEQQNTKRRAESLESVESLDNNNNANIEIDCKSSMESLQNNQNERISFENEQSAEPIISYESEQSSSLPDAGAYEFSDISIGVLPVHFITTDEGIFFWTASSDIPADNDLEEALNCHSENQLACMQQQDRWAQA